MVKLTTLMPTVLSKLISMDMTNKISLIFSNVPGPKQPLVIAGETVQKLVFFAPGMGSLNASLNICSHADILKVGCVSDDSLINDPAFLIELFEKNFDKLLKELQ